MKQKNTSISNLAKKFMLIRYGRIKDCETQKKKDRYNERLGMDYALMFFVKSPIPTRNMIELVNIIFYL